MTETSEKKAATKANEQSETFKLYGKHGVVPVGVESEAIPENNNPESKGERK